MKNSNIDWIGQIPDDWEVRKVKQCFYISKSKAKDKNPTILSLARAGIKVRDISNNEGQLAASYEDYNPVQSGDLLLNPMDLYSGANCNVSEVSGVISPAYVNLRALENLESKYFDYYFKVQYWAMAMFAHGKGISFDNRWTMNSDAVLNYYIPYPSPEKQKKIVEFLDKKCSEVDKLIEIENQQIEKLKEYKINYISEKIIRGIDNKDFKESNLEWIGRIPECWKICRIKDIIEKSDFGIKCGPFGSSLTGKVVDNGEIIIYGQWNVVDGDFERKRNTLKYEDFKSLSSYEVKSRDVLVSMMGTVGKCAIVPDNIKQGVMDSHLIKIRLNESMVNPEFFAMQYDKDTSNIVFEHYQRTKKGSIMDGLNTSIIKNAYFVLPPYQEQLKILTHLKLKIKSIDKLIETKQIKIEKLQEYKKSLIYECVTGKKEII